MDNIPEYHQGVIKMKIDCYREQQTKWENYFKQNNITPLRLYSEELEQETTIKQIADYLGIDSTKQFSNPPFPDIQEQGRSEIIKEYKERFIKETNLF
jgi:LPS sulfotransferase NodH